MTLVLAFLGALLAAFGGLLGAALWRSGGRLLAALVEIGRLPDVVTELVTELRNAIAEVRALAGRVERLEKYLPDAVRVTADVTLSTEG